MSDSRPLAIVLANSMYRDSHAKTSHALVRGPSRYHTCAVVDASCAGHDAGELLDGQPRDIPIVATIDDAIALGGRDLQYCIIGLATAGGVLPDELRADLLTAARHGLTLVNGMHGLLEDDAEIAAAAKEHGGGIVDIRKPKKFGQLRFCTGEIHRVQALIIALMGTDCAVGKRTSSHLLRQACVDAGLNTQVIFTGQTGWLQGSPYGFVLDATLNDFVCGELEGEILRCEDETHPDVILIEGQASLRNPTGPCGSEFLISGGAKGVILQHDPLREHHIDAAARQVPIADLRSEIELIRAYGADVWAISLNEARMQEQDKEPIRARVAEETGLPVVLPFTDGMSAVAAILAEKCKER